MVKIILKHLKSILNVLLIIAQNTEIHPLLKANATPVTAANSHCSSPLEKLKRRAGENITRYLVEMLWEELFGDKDMDI